MDYPVSGSNLETGAVVALADRYQFSSGEVVGFCCVESRCLLWGTAGSGTVETHGRTVEITPSTFMFLPWRHDITYRAAVDDPFMVSAVHVIPWHDPSVPLELYVAHERGDRLAGAAHRRDMDWPELGGVLHGTMHANARLFAAANLAIDHMRDGRPDTGSLRALAAIMLNELRSAIARPGTPDGPYVTEGDVPPRLARMHEFIASHLRLPLSVSDVASSGGMSVSSAERFFRRYCGTSVVQWITAKRLSVARDLLRTTNRSVTEVARAVGYEDPSYFSRVFRRTHGTSPRSYARRSRLS